VVSFAAELRDSRGLTVAVMDRRRFLLTPLAGAFAGPLSVGAQQTGKAPRIGFLAGGSSGSAAPLVEAFRQGLRELGYTEGRSIIIEYCSRGRIRSSNSDLKS
jgi:hypothetical protein